MMRTGFLTLVATLAGGLSANAAFVTSAAGFPTPTTVIDFSAYASTFADPIPVPPGASLGSGVAAFSTNSFNDGVFVGDATFGLGSNGTWNSGRGGFVGVNSSTGSVTFTFDSPVSSVGGFLNYSPGTGTPTITALGAGGVVLETYNSGTAGFTISTPGGVNAGAFRGISRASNDITAFRIANSFIVLDDLTFGRLDANPVPAPATLLGVALAGPVAGFLARRRRAAV